MQIQISSDHNIHGLESLNERISADVESALGRISEHVTRVAVHVSNQNDKTGGHQSSEAEIRCMMEARIEGQHRFVVTHIASTLNEAVDDAAAKLARLTEHALQRRRGQRNFRPPSHETELRDQ